MCVGLLGANVAAQTPTPEPLRFEVSSIKPNHSGSTTGGTQGTPLRWEATNIWLKALVGQAYDLRVYQVVGGPSWTETDRYDVKVTTGRVVTLDEGREMLRTLLAERFKFVAHKETRDLPSWELVLVRNDRKFGPSLRPCLAECNDGRASFLPGKWTSKGSPISVITTYLSAYLRAPVMDRTGLDGSYVIDLQWSPAESQDATPGGEAAAVVLAVQEQLGLRLNRTRAAVEVLVIDRVERPDAD
jgi:uncharacterized protein (TIGR03435 family)